MDLAELRELEHYANEREFQTEFAEHQGTNKQKLTEVIQNATGVTVDPDLDV